mgnify:CR=1 FL=1
MNCTKPEELAVVNWPDSRAHNHIVMTKEFIAPNMRFLVGNQRWCVTEGPAWWVESPLPFMTPVGPLARFPILDKHLRPIGTPEHGGVEQNTFQRPLPTLAESITGALNRMKYGSQS